MNARKLIPIFCLIVMSLSLASCGPKPLSDAEFSDAAKTVCHTLNTESASLGEIDLGSRAAVYTQATDALTDLTITEKSAPQGTALRSGLAELSDAFENLGKAIDDAATKANLTAPVTVLIGDDGTMFGYGKSVLPIIRLDVDPTLMPALQALQTKVRDAANSLNLAECIINWP